MLKTLDVLIGLSVVMLLVSMVVTAMTQCVLGLRNSRGKHLLSGIEAILVQIDPNLKDHAGKIATAVLTHPLIGPSNGKLAGVVFRGELVRAVMELATSWRKNDRLSRSVSIRGAAHFCKVVRIGAPKHF